MKSNVPAAILLKPGVLWLAKNPDMALAPNVSSACAVTPKGSAVERAAHASIQAWVWMTVIAATVNQMLKHYFYSFL